MLKGKAYDMKGDYAKAAEVFENNLKDYKKMVQKNANKLDAEQSKKEIGNLEFRLGWSLIRGKKDLERGVQYLNEAEKKMPDNWDLKIKLAQCLFQEQGKIDEPIGILNKVLESSPENHASLFLLGKIMFKNKEYAKAEDNFQKAIDVQDKYREPPQSAGIYFHLGQCQELQANYSKAIKSF